MQALDEARAEAESCLRRAEAAEAQAGSVQATATNLSAQLTQLEARFMEEQLIRKKYHNQIQDMKGNIRVFCRFRPLGKREQENGDVPVLHKADAFSVDLQRPAPTTILDALNLMLSSAVTLRRKRSSETVRIWSRVQWTATM